MTAILLTAGVVALMAAVIGGGLKAFEIHVPVLPNLRVRAALGALGIAFLIAAVLLSVDESQDVTPLTPTSRSAAPRHPPQPRPPCSDGRDNDRDGTTDYPNDSDCSSRDDRSEKNAACSDGRDNDRDGMTDYPDDSDCSSRDDPAEKQ